MRRQSRDFLLSYGYGILVVLMYVLTGSAVTPSSLFIILRQTVSWFPCVLGELLLILPMGINLSVGGQVILIATLLHLSIQFTSFPYMAAVAAGIVLSAFFGLLFAFVYEWTGVPVTILSYCMQFVLFGIGSALYDFSHTGYTAADAVVDIGSGSLLFLILFGLLPAVFVSFLMMKTSLGRCLTLLYRSPLQAELSDMPVKNIRRAGYILGFALIGLGGAAYSVHSGVFIGFNFDTIQLINYTSSILVGVSMGGIHGLSYCNLVPRALYGSCCLVLLTQLEQLWHISSYGSLVIGGVILLVTEAIRGGIDLRR